VAVHPSEPDIVYAGLAFAGLYRSQDGGASWQPRAAGLNPEASISDVVFDPTDPQVMYTADRFSGVYRSGDGGATWFSTVQGLRTRAVNALAITSDGGHLYAATEGEGVFRLDLSGQPPQPAPTPVPGQANGPTPTAASRLATATPIPSQPGGPTPTAVSRLPTATPAPATAAWPTATPEATAPSPTPSVGGGICGGLAALSLAFLLTWAVWCR
jgi:hypothetical protein